MPNFTEHLRELAARLPFPAKETNMEFGPIPPSKEVQLTIDGVTDLMTRTRETLVRQIKQCHIEMHTVDLAALEHDVYITTMHLLKVHSGRV
jgi:hypothetical protein